MIRFKNVDSILSMLVVVKICCLWYMDVMGFFVLLNLWIKFNIFLFKDKYLGVWLFGIISVL